MGEELTRIWGAATEGLVINASHDSGEAAVGDNRRQRSAGKLATVPSLAAASSRLPKGRVEKGPRDGPTRRYPSPRPRTYRGTRSGWCSGPERLRLRRYWRLPRSVLPWLPGGHQQQVRATASSRSPHPRLLLGTRPGLTARTATLTSTAQDGGRGMMGAGPASGPAPRNYSQWDGPFRHEPRIFTNQRLTWKAGDCRLGIPITPRPVGLIPPFMETQEDLLLVTENYCPPLPRAWCTAHAHLRVPSARRVFPWCVGFGKKKHTTDRFWWGEECSTQKVLCAQFSLSRQETVPVHSLTPGHGTSSRLFPPRFPVLCYAMIQQARQLRIVTTLITTLTSTPKLPASIS